MQFSENDIERFAAWSGDHNPLHIDAGFAQEAGFTQPTVHAVLSAFGALGSVCPRAVEALRTLDVEFRGAVLPDVEYDIGWVRDPGELGLTVSQAGAEKVVIAGEFGTAFERPVATEFAWVGRLEASRELQEPWKRFDVAQPGLDELESGLKVTGVYATDPPPEAATASGYLTAVQARTLGLCSYLTDMEFPGLRSSLTRVKLQFHDVEADASQLWYRAGTLRLDRHSRILDVVLEVATPDGRPVATGELQSYVRHTPAAIDLAALAARLPASERQLTGKIALVCGGSRGLGADLSAALALAGCRVYAGYQTASAAARQLARRLAERNLEIEFLRGDAGDPAWCATALETIRARHGRLDILVLNACTPPAEFRLGLESAPRFEEYCRANLRLACAPLATFLPMLDESRGMVTCISSSLVTDPQPGFAHYVALKQAVEGAVQTATRESTRLWSLIVRPPRLLTSWNDTPASVANAIPAHVVACGIVGRLAGEWRPGQVELLAEHLSFDASGSTTRIESREAVAPLISGNVERCEPLETDDLDADAILVSIDAQIAAELAAAPVGTGEFQNEYGANHDRGLLPDLSEIDPWHESSDGAAAESYGAFPALSDDVHYDDHPLPEQVAGRPSGFEGFPADEQLFEFLSQFQGEVAEAVRLRSPAEGPEDQSTAEMDVFVLPDETEQRLPARETCAAPPASAASSADADAADAAENFGHGVEPVPVLIDDDDEFPTAPARDDRAPISETVVATETDAGEITTLAPDGEEEILRFEEHVRPDCRPEHLLPRWNWTHVASATRLGLESRTWIYREVGELLAYCGAVPVKLKVGTEEHAAAWLPVTTVPDAERAERAGTRLLARAGEELPLGLSLAASGPARAALLQAGWTEVAQLEMEELLIHPDVVLQGKHAGSTTLSDWGLRATTVVRTLFQHRARLDVQQVGRFDDRHDRLWQYVSRDIACGVVRDASYLNWKYVEQPAQEILRLEVSDANALLGVVVLNFRTASEAHPYRHACLADLLAPFADVQLLAQLIQVASTAAAERGADALLCEHAGQSLKRALRQCGFAAREPGRFLFAHPGRLPPESRELLLAGKDWLITPGDVDFSS